LIFIAAGLVAVALLFVLAAQTPNTPPRLETAAATPSAQETWVTYIPETPEVCQDAMDKADETIEQAHNALIASLDALERQRLGAPPVAELKDAQAAEEKFTKLSLAYVKLAKGCRTWGGPSPTPTPTNR
jgi:hypothetical protein